MIHAPIHVGWAFFITAHRVASAMTEKPNLSVEEVACWLGVDARTVYRLVKRGKLPGFKAGNQWRFNQEMLQAWMAEQVTMEWLRVEDRNDSGQQAAQERTP